MKYFAGILAFAAAAMADGTGVPIAVFHRLGDLCLDPGMKHFAKELGNGTNSYSKCIESGAVTSSFLHTFTRQSEQACEKVKADPNFQGDFYVVGLSQGSLIARYIAEKCDVAGSVKKVLSIGGPNMGVDSVPGCMSDEGISGKVNNIARKFVYMNIVQNHIGPADYFRDTHHYNRYLRKSSYLADLNNEGAEKDASIYDRFSSMDGAMFVMFTQDTTVIPKESEWFYSNEWNKDTKSYDMTHRTDTDFYKEDYIGLRALEEAGKASYVEIDGMHLQFSNDDINNTFIPFLLQ